ncbi:hypothetical protein EVAR_4401_1 [Eumeta japonica]|uniref:Uncharacterized protein n=1 Tax=Eumeta variegata TaxID=151549 RepID=A0A4C1T092_EUMVA|nr:hypothetical protein EVAR_4401_1 [Eumeta japonica]
MPTRHILRKLPTATSTRVQGALKPPTQLHLCIITIAFPLSALLITKFSFNIFGYDSAKTSGTKATAHPKAKSPPPIYLRNKGKWNAVSAESNKLHINYISARNMLHEYVNCNSEGHPANYKGCPKVPHFFKNAIRNKKVTSKRSVSAISDKNFPSLAGKTSRAIVDVTQSIPPSPTHGLGKHPQGLIRNCPRRLLGSPLKSATAKQTATSAGPFGGEDTLTIMSMLRVVKSPELSTQLTADFRKTRSREDCLKAQTPSYYDLKRSPTRCVPHASLTSLGDSARAESPRDFLYRDAHIVASIGQSHAIGIPYRSAAIDKVLKAPIYWGYGQQPSNMLLRGFFGP